MQLNFSKRRLASLLRCALIALPLALMAGCDRSASAVAKLPTAAVFTAAEVSQTCGCPSALAVEFPGLLPDAEPSEPDNGLPANELRTEIYSYNGVEFVTECPACDEGLKGWRQD